MATKPEIPPPVQENGYADGLDGSTANKAPREGVTRLNDLLSPQSIKRKRAQEAAWGDEKKIVKKTRLRDLLPPHWFERKQAEKAAWEDAKKIVEKPWTEAQLKHCGISKAEVPPKQASLAKVVSDGLCHTVPEAIQSIETELPRLLEPMKQGYVAKANEYSASEAKRVNREFAALSSPTAELEYSSDMFLRKYFLDEGGKPDMSKTPVPISLPGFSNPYQIHAAVKRIPGLCTASRGHGDDRMMAIGWDQDAVRSVAGGQAVDQSALRQKQVEKAEWNKLMQQHESLVSQARSRHRAAQFSMHGIGGIYVIECDKIGSYSSEISYNNTLRLRIIESQREGCVGIFDFGVLTGIMLLDESEERLASRAVSLDKNPYETQHDSGDETETDDSSQTDSSNETDDNSNEFGALKKRKAKLVEKASQSRQKRRQNKRNGSTVFFQWRGEKSGEGEIQLDAANNHVGRLRFSNNDRLRFEGIADFGFIGRHIAFAGYKIESLGGPATRSWSDYSKAAYERARAARSH